MADELTVPQHTIDHTRSGVYIQLETCVKYIKDFDGTIDEAIDHYGLRSFIENQIAVSASEQAYTQMLQNILHKETFNGAYADL